MEKTRCVLIPNSLYTKLSTGETFLSIHQSNALLVDYDGDTATIDLFFDDHKREWVERVIVDYNFLRPR